MAVITRLTSVASLLYLMILGWIGVEPVVSSMARAESGSERGDEKDREVAVSMFLTGPAKPLHCRRRMSHHAIVEDRWEAAHTAASVLAWCQLMHNCGGILIVVVLHSTGHAPVWECRLVLVLGWQVAGVDVDAHPLELG